jgi:serine/threonine protein kinase/ABC-type nitrate/sulfonate/bicarbonate transport system substrate-binding protein
MKPEESILADALERPASERGAFVARACGGNGVLRDRVLALLRGYEGAGAELEASPVAGVAKSARAGAAGEARDYAPGTRIGRYKLLERLGEGGCGVVFMAEQEEPVHRRVALKVIKLGMDTREVIARFEAERQALALMDHPNIAHVLDAGATESGRPFFVMELVRGVPITHHCDQYRLTTVGRVQLFIQVCSAIQHAHQKGIIHRDLKPSNILVTLHDGVPVPKIIDFGIAKAMHGPLTDRTLFTAFEQFIGTPAYMSPEQMEMSGIDIDTRSDLYSLGVLLYELLTGRTPFDTRDLLKSGLEGMRRTVREKEPAKPSTRVSTLNVADRIAIAAQRGTDPARLHSWLRGDVDWIVMRCLEKDRTRRYETASGLALDLQRYLRNEPITARPPSTAYALRKLVRRNQLAFGAASAVVIALVAGLAFSAFALARERLARQRADLEAARSAQLARRMPDMLAGVGPQVAVGRDTRLLRTILDETVVRMDRQLRGQPEVEASFRETLGNVYRDLGEFAAAALMYERALQLRREVLGGEHAAVADSLHDLGEVRGRQGRLTEAETYLREALALREKRLGGEHPDTVASRRALAHVGRLARPTNGESNGRAAESTEDDGIEAPLTVIRMALAGGTVGGKPLMFNLLAIAHQRRVLEQEFEGDRIRIEWSSPSYYTARENLVRTRPDFFQVGPVNALISRATGLDYKLVLPIHGLEGPLALVVRADSPFRTLADLRGRRLGICRGTRSHLELCRLIERNGLREADFNLVAFPGNAAIDTAFAAGGVEARMVDGDDRADAGLRRGVRVVSVEHGGRDLESPGKLAVSAEFERRHPAVVQRVVTALVKSAAWSSDERNRAQVLELGASSPERLAALGAATAGPGLKECMSPLLDDRFTAGLRRDCEDAKRFGLIPADADMSLEGWVEPKYLRQALRELNLEGYWPERDAEGRVQAGRERGIH